MSKEFSYEINEEFGTEIISEGGNSFVGLRKISWNGREEKVDIRKYMVNSDGNEIMGKGISLSEEEANTLTNTLVDKGYGDPKHIIKSYADNNNTKAIGSMYMVLNDMDPEYVSECALETEGDEDEGFDAESLFDSVDEEDED